MLDRFTAGIALLLCAAFATAAEVKLEGIRFHEAPDSTRVVFDTSGATDYNVFTLPQPKRVVIDLHNAVPDRHFEPSVAAEQSARIKALRGAPRDGGYRIVIDTDADLIPDAFTLAPVSPYGHRLVVDLLDKERPKPAPRAANMPRNRDVVIAIDAGHGGDDPGTLGPNRIVEKRVVLQIARRVANRLNNQPGFRAELVRTGDYYISLKRRTDIAREKFADLFISIHADAFSSPKVNGAGVYILSDRSAASETARWLADRENRSDLLGGVGAVSIGDKDPDLAKILLDLSMDAKRSHSIEVGEAVLANLARVTKLHKKRVEPAPFIVLKRPDIPSILVEAGFISNPTEARRLSQAEHQDKIARAISTGVEQFMRSNPPPGTLLAESDNELRYTIVRGDTISKIATKYGVSVKALRSQNDLRGDKIRVGQVIVIPFGS